MSTIDPRTDDDMADAELDDFNWQAAAERKVEPKSAGGFEPIPEAVYRLYVKKAERIDDASKARDPKMPEKDGSVRYDFEVRVIQHEEHTGRRLWKRFYVRAASNLLSKDALEEVRAKAVADMEKNQAEFVAFARDYIGHTGPISKDLHELVDRDFDAFVGLYVPKDPNKKPQNSLWFNTGGVDATLAAKRSAPAAKAADVAPKGTGIPKKAKDDLGF